MKLTGFFSAAGRARLALHLLALCKLVKHPDTPRAPKWIALAVLAYAVSPIDLIPDFIPVLGLLDELIVLPLGIALAIRLTPAPLWQARLAEAQASADQLPKMLWGALLVVALWLIMLGALGWWAWGRWGAA